MDVYYNNRGKWDHSDHLFDAFGLDEAIGRRGGEQGAGPVGNRDQARRCPYVIALTGGGGKTSLIRRLAWEGRERGLRVLVTTTTHMAVPEHFGVFTGRAADVSDMLDRESVAVACSVIGQGKVSALDSGFYETACSLADFVLVEADGAKRLPLKVPRPGEPVVPENTNMILCVSGLTAIGEPALEKCFRLDAAVEIMGEHGREDYGDRETWRIEPGDLICLMRHGYLKPLRARYPDACVIPVFNQADTPEPAQLARKLLDEMKESRGAVSGGLLNEPSAELF